LSLCCGRSPGHDASSCSSFTSPFLIDLGHLNANLAGRDPSLKQGERIPASFPEASILAPQFLEVGCGNRWRPSTSASDGIARASAAAALPWPRGATGLCATPHRAVCTTKNARGRVMGYHCPFVSLTGAQWVTAPLALRRISHIYKDECLTCVPAPLISSDRGQGRGPNLPASIIVKTRAVGCPRRRPGHITVLTDTSNHSCCFMEEGCDAAPTEATNRRRPTIHGGMGRTVRAEVYFLRGQETWNPLD
jgi:hypothetical protein